MTPNELIIRVNTANTAGRTLTGDTRNAEITASDTQTKEFVNVSPTIGHTTNGPSGELPYDVAFTAQTFPAGKRVRIKSVRACLDGGADARSGSGNLAFTGAIVADDGTDKGNEVCLQCAEYGVAYEVNEVLDGRSLSAFGITYKAGSKFSLDDFGIDADFVDETVKPYLEITAEVL